MKKALKIIWTIIKGVIMLGTGIAAVIAVRRWLRRGSPNPIPPKDVTVTPIPGNLNEAREYGSLADRIERAR